MSIYSYLLITPDGQQWDLNETKWQVDAGIPDGFDLPEIAHDTQVLYNQPGAVLKSVQVQPRVVTITAKLVGSCRDELHQVRAALWQALRWNREGRNPPSYSILRYEANGQTTDLHCYFLSDVLSGGDGETNQAVGYKLIAYDPFWYGDTLNTRNLGLQSTLAVSYNAGKINGLWSALGNNGTAMTLGESHCAIYDRTRNCLYIGGDFVNWAGIANADYIAKYDLNTNTWSALSTGANDKVRALVLGSNGMLYVGGKFTSIGGVAVNYLARYNPDTDTFSSITPGGANNGFVNALAFDFSRNRLYIGGDFTTLDGVARVRLCYYNIATAAFTTMGAGVNGVIWCLRVAPSGLLFVGGNYTSILGVAANAIARYDPIAAAASAMGAGTNDTVYAIAIAPNGDVYIGGMFTNPYPFIARWNGTQWLKVGTTFTILFNVYNLEFDQNGLLYICAPVLIGGTSQDQICTWNGTAFSRLDIDAPGVTPNFLAVCLWDDNIYLMFDSTGNATVSYSITNIPMIGDEEAYPIFTLTGPGVLQHIENTEDGKKMIFNLSLSPGEVVTIDLTPLQKTLSSDMRGSLFPYAAMLPLSDFASWSLQPAPLAPNGDNDILVYMSDITPVELNDNNNQLSGWTGITGLTFDNTDNGKLYVNIVVDGGGFYHVDLYDDSARTHKVGHTATYNSNGAKAIVADNASGLGGTVTVDARTAADTDIVVYFAVAKVEWYDRFLSADSAVAPDRIK